ncbi:hypothetical protein [Halapricum hydrolyticum]|uniref:Uncharacterized protein n=1 Tax=Halapricum hydrolyticum TaxID=2979991 RepID=A0AAE3IC85_9EURY|nr:hypothetical protein [Halapricum hydrolyticum]MCU4718947.1 hypothetical protein [Halapricum hydrolyticum]MCU4727960.1 hypothetical protein [Halapricum hydrolyticum]
MSLDAGPVVSLSASVFAVVLAETVGTATVMLWRVEIRDHLGA